MLKELHKAEFTLGAPLSFGVYDVFGKLLLRRGFVLEYDEQLMRLLSRGIYRDDEADARLAANDALRLSSNITVSPARQERKPVYERISASTLRLKSMITDLRSQQPSEEIGKRISALAREILNDVREDNDAALAAIHLDFHNLYILSHQVHNAVLCALIGERLKLSDAELNSLMCAALTCDVGMTDLPEFEKQKGPLTEGQKVELRKHPVRAVEMLTNAKVTNLLWLEIVAKHHARIDDSGYPTICLDQTLLPVGILPVVDSYMSLIKPRPWREAKIPLAALKELFTLKTVAFCTNGGRAYHALVKELGMYPPGSVVRLANNELAVVGKRCTDIRTPYVYSLYEKSGVPRLTPIPRDTSDANFAITAALPYSECRAVSLIISRLWTRQHHHSWSSV